MTIVQRAIRETVAQTGELGGPPDLQQLVRHIATTAFLKLTRIAQQDPQYACDALLRELSMGADALVGELIADGLGLSSSGPDTPDDGSKHGSH